MELSEGVMTPEKPNFEKSADTPSFEGSSKVKKKDRSFIEIIDSSDFNHSHMRNTIIPKSRYLEASIKFGTELRSEFATPVGKS